MTTLTDEQKQYIIDLYDKIDYEGGIYAYLQDYTSVARLFAELSENDLENAFPVWQPEVLEAALSAIYVFDTELYKLYLKCLFEGDESSED